MSPKRQPQVNQVSNVTPLRQTYQLKITLEHIKPPIWRRLLVDSRITLDALHDAIQVSMGWENAHLHHFIDRQNTLYAPLNEDTFGFSDLDQIDESMILLHELLTKEKDWIKYEYDFGDGWEHKILLEKILPMEKNQFPVSCIKGKRACPPEDCGGPWGYSSVLEALAEPDTEEHAELLEWLEADLDDPEFFSSEETNVILQEVFEGAKFKAKPGLPDEMKRVDEHGESDLFNEDFFGEMLSDISAASPEVKELLSGMHETIGVMMEMSELLDQAAEALETIATISKDKKVVAIAKKMLKNLDE
jgi:hypothetical protein